MLAPHPSQKDSPEGRPPTIRVAFGSVPKDGGTYTFYRTLRPVLRSHGIDLRCVSVGRDQAALTDPAFLDDGCVQLVPRMAGLKDQAWAFAEWCARERMDIVFGVNSQAILSAIPHLPERIRVMARCANGFDEGYRLTLVGQERLSRIVALVPRLHDDLIASYDVDPARIALIPNGASPRRFDAAAGRSRGSEDRLELGFLGRFEHGQKGVLHLPRVVEELDRAGVSYRLTIAGRGRDEARLRQDLAPGLAEGRIRFVGTLPPDRIPTFLGGIDAFLFPSHFEGCPNALLEAMMAGAVPIAWRLPGITDFLDHDGTTGFLAEKGDTAQFATRVAQLSGSPDLLRTMSRRVAADARARFSETVCADAYVALLGQVMAEPAPAWTPRPWSQFRPDPLFRQHPFARFVPPEQRRAIRSLARRLRPRVPARQSEPPVGGGLRVHHIINSCDLRLGGAERMARRLHAGLLEEGIDSRLVSLQAFGDGAGDAPPGAVSLGLTTPYNLRALPALAAYVRTIGPGDIVHGHLFPTSAYLATLARTRHLSGPLVFTEHSTSNRRRANPLGGYIDAGVYGAFDRIVAISEGVREALVQAQPSAATRTVVIPNGSPLPFDALVPRDDPQAPLTVLSVGRMTPAKNYGTALRAIARLEREVRYVIAGDGPELATMREMAAALGLSDRVEFAGHVPDIRSLLEAADVFLIPSAWEGFGLAAVEAMNAGLPVIASDVPGLREVVGTDGTCARLVDPANADGIAAALGRLIDDPEARRNLGIAGHARARLFGFDACLRRHLDLYRSLVADRSNAA